MVAYQRLLRQRSDTKNMNKLKDMTVDDALLLVVVVIVLVWWFFT